MFIVLNCLENDNELVKDSITKFIELNAHMIKLRTQILFKQQICHKAVT